MNRKYQIISANTVIPMVINVKKILPEDNNEENIPISIKVGVNYAQDKVFFEEREIHPDIDYLDLEQEILSYLRPSTVDSPYIPAEVLDKISKVRSGNYQKAFNQEFQNDHRKV